MRICVIMPAMSESENTYSIATANILDPSTIGQALTWDIQKHVDMAEASGWNGRIELWPQGMIPLIQISQGIPTELRSKITSAHQSFREGRIGIHNVKEALFLPESVSSVGQLEAIDSQVGGIPVVLYRNVSRERLDASPLRVKQTQTDAQACTQWNVSSPQEFLDAVEANGFTDEHGNPAVVWDTHHVRHADTKSNRANPLAQWRKSLPVLLPFTREIHLGVGREDSGDMDKAQIRSEAEDLLNKGQKNTEVVEMLRSIADRGWHGLVVLEMRPSVIKSIVGSMSTDVLKSTYASIKETLYHVFDK